MIGLAQDVALLVPDKGENVVCMTADAVPSASHAGLPEWYPAMLVSGLVLPGNGADVEDGPVMRRPA